MQKYFIILFLLLLGTQSLFGLEPYRPRRFNDKIINTLFEKDINSCWSDIGISGGYLGFDEEYDNDTIVYPSSIIKYDILQAGLCFKTKDYKTYIPKPDFILLRFC